MTAVNFFILVSKLHAWGAFLTAAEKICYFKWILDMCSLSSRPFFLFEARKLSRQDEFIWEKLQDIVI